MREHKPFGKRQDNKRQLPSDEVLKDTFGVVNEGCDSKQIVYFIERTTGHKVKGGDDKK